MAQKNEATLLIRIKQAGGEILDKIGVSMSGLKDAAFATGTALVGFAAVAIKSFRDSELATNELNQAMVNQGIYTADLAKSYENMASKLEGLTTFSDEQITSAQATLQTYIGQRQVTEELTKATLDFAAAKGMDLKSASEVIAKSIGSETNALARYGIEVDKTASKQEQMAQVIGQLNTKFAGQAEAQAKGLGSLEQMKNALDNLMESFGERIAPFVTFFARQITLLSGELQKNTGVLEVFDMTLLGLTKTFTFVKHLTIGVTEALSIGLAGAVEAVSLALSGKFVEAKNMMQMGMDEVATAAKERTLALEQELYLLDQQSAMQREADRVAEEELIKASEQRKHTAKIVSNQTMFTEEQKQAAKILGVKLKEKADLETLEKAKVAAQKETLGTIASLQGESNKTLATIGKAAALTQIAIDTPVAISKALAAFPPPFNYAAAAAVGAAMAAQTARVTGIKLAEGGIVPATHGGVPAIIGEGGKDEAVIPLDSEEAQGRLGGGGVTIHFNGPILGDESQAREFARAIDKELLQLRRTNQSVAFEATF